MTFGKAREFSKDYPSFLEIPVDTMKNLCQSRKLQEILPKNIREYYSEVSMDEVAQDLIVIAKLEEQVPLVLQDVLKVRNAEIEQRALKIFGYERFVAEAKPVVLDAQSENQLLKLGDVTLLYLLDASTPRRYLLRVPPTSNTVQEALAWTFNLEPSEYRPIREA